MLSHLWSTLIMFVAVITIVVDCYYIFGRYYICGQLLHLWLLHIQNGFFMVGLAVSHAITLLEMINSGLARK